MIHISKNKEKIGVLALVIGAVLISLLLLLLKSPLVKGLFFDQPIHKTGWVEIVSFQALSLIFLSILFYSRPLIYKPLSAVAMLFAIGGILMSFLKIVHDLLNSASQLQITLYLNPTLGSWIVTFLMSWALYIWPSVNRTAKTSMFVTCLITVTGFLGFLSIGASLLSADLQTAWQFIAMNPALGLCYVMLTLAVLIWNFHKDREYQIKVVRALPLILGFGVILFHFFLINGLLREQEIANDEIIKNKILAIRSDVQAIFLQADNQLISLALELNNQPSDIRTLERRARFTMQELFSLKAVYIVGNNQTVEDQFFAGLKDDGSALELQIINKLLEQKVWFNPDSKNLYIRDMFVDNQAQAKMLVFEINLVSTFEALKQQYSDHAWNLFISCNGVPIFENQDSFKDLNEDNYFLASFDRWGLSFEIIGAPISRFFIDALTKGLILYVGFGGILGGLLTGSTVFLTQLMREKNKQNEKAKHEIAMSNEIMKIMNEATDIGRASRRILEILNQYDGWQLFCYWQWNDKKKAFTLQQSQSLPEGAFKSFEQAIAKTAQGLSLLGDEITNSKASTWVADYSLTKASFAAQAKEVGLKGAMGFPLLKGSQLVGIIEIFKSSPLLTAPDQEKIRVMGVLANEFSLFAEKRAVELLNKEFTAIVTNTKEAVCKFDSRFVIQSCNPGAEIMFGRLSSELEGLSIFDLLRAGQTEAIAHIQEIIKSNQRLENYKVQGIKKDGTSFWLESLFSPIVSDLGAAQGYFVIFKDINKEYEASQKIKLNEARYRLFVDTTHAWIWEMDKEGNITFSNPAVQLLLGYKEEEVIGKNIRNFAENPELLSKELAPCFSNQQGWRQRIWKAHSNKGTILILESTADPQFDENGYWTGFRGVDRDVTEELAVAQSKDEFLSMVSHELRTPLTSIIGAVGLLKQQADLSTENKELVELAQRNATRLSRLINDILDIEKIMLGKMPLNLKPMNIVDAIDEAIKIAAPQAAVASLQITKTFQEKVAGVRADYDRTVQVILNLLTNAIKFSYPGQPIEIQLQKNTGTWRVSVKDEGQGIPLEFQEKIFQKFVQGQPGDKKTSGTGLGLSICKGIITQMGGTISFTSEPGKGAIFYFDLPVEELKT